MGKRKLSKRQLEKLRERKRRKEVPQENAITAADIYGMYGSVKCVVPPSPSREATFAQSLLMMECLKQLDQALSNAPEDSDEVTFNVTISKTFARHALDQI